MIGQTISHYRILEKIGEGGMSVVYKAEDTTLRRHVALKFPSEQVLADKAKKARFIQEARASAALDHPNICTLYEIDEAQGKTFISMAYVEGQSLFEKIVSGPLDLDEAVDISIQAAEGLYEAHEKGIVHRDIKSANIMVTNSGQVKIMDFGLAKLAGETSLTRLTQAGAIMGTVDYMSPEQAKGEAVDYRTDIWSLGVVMYEMLTGELPFKGGGGQAVIHSILYDEPKRLRDLRRDVPAALEQTVLKTMQKDPSNRADSMKAVIADLEPLSPKPGLSKEQAVSKRTKLRTASVIVAALACVGISALLYLRPWAGQEKGLSSIAVLPFVNMSADPNQEYFCDGMSEELINALSQIKDLRVIARTSAFSFKGKDVTVRDIGSQLNVAAILEGSVRKAEGRLRITVQLIDTTDGSHLWSGRYDRQMGDVFAIQDEITLAIVDKLKPKLLGQEKARLAKRQAIDTEVYNLCLMGRHYLRSKLVSDPNKASEYYRQALEIDPNCALAYAGLANCYNAFRDHGLLSPKEAMQKAREMAEKAMKIDETLPEAHDALASVKTWFDWDWEGGERHYRRAIELNPGFALALQRYAINLLVRGRFDEAIAQMKLAFISDPLSPDLNASLGFAYICVGRLDDAIETLNRAVEMDPSRPGGHFFLGHFYLGKSMYEEALDEYRKAMERSGEMSLWPEMFIGLTYAQMGKPDKAKEVLANQLERSNQQYISSFMFALLHFALGNNDEGFKLLDKAYEEHDPTLCWLKIHPLLDSIRSDPRYTALLKKMNLDK